MTMTATAHFPRRVTGQAGSATVSVLGILAVVLVLVGTALNIARHNFRTGHQSSRWSQAMHAAEAGAEIGLMTAQKNSWTTDEWSGAPGSPGAAAVTKTVTLSAGVPSAGLITTTVAVDKVSMGGAQWLRIRSRGFATLAGGAAPGIDARDAMLRKLSLRRDRKSGAVVTTPQATREVEILAAPKAARPFKYSFISKELFDIHTNTTSDSYDSSDPNKSNFTPFTTYGIYDAAKRQTNGDVGTIDALHTWNLNDARIWGDVLTPTGDVDHSANVSGSVTDDLTFTFPDEVSPGWTVVTTNHGIVTNVSKSLTGGTQASPTRHKFTSINLSSDTKNIRIRNPVGQTESWIELWVTGDVFIDGKNQTGIKIDPGVHATIHFGSKVEIKGGGGGYALSNDSKLPANLIVRAYGGSSGAIKDMIIAYTDFWGVVSAPWYKVKFDMSGKHVHGSFLSWQFDCSDGTNLHYDEALGNLELGQGSGYEVRSWVEAVR
jgi:hypothetical protein